MQFTTSIIAAIMASVTVARNVPIASRAYTGITEEQSRNAGAAVWKIQQYGLGRQACLAVMATALQESELLVYANPRVPESMQYRHDREGGDQDSVGMFQQRPEWYPNIAVDMDPAGSTGQFLDAMKQVNGWEWMEVSALCQQVQKAEAGNLYGQRIPEATQICNEAGF